MKNDFGIPLVSDDLWSQLFTGKRSKPTILSANEALAEFKNFGIVPGSAEIESPKLSPKLPELIGGSLSCHFQAIGDRFRPILDKAKAFASIATPAKPERDSIVLQSGWTMYHAGGSEPVKYPSGDAMVLDTETMVLLGNTVVMAVAVSDRGWFIWLHPALVDHSLEFTNLLLPVAPGAIYIAHNALFDASKTDQAYSDKPLNTYWLDTLSMHQAVSGISSKMRALYKLIEAGKAEFVPEWFEEGSTADLISCYNLHVRPDNEATKEEKTIRDLFVKSPTIEPIRNRLLDLVEYNIADVDKGFELFKALLPKYLADNPSPVTFAGALIMADSTLPVIDNWHEWLASTEELYQSETQKISVLLLELADQIYDDWSKLSSEDQQDMIASDAWLQQLDWTLESVGRGKSKRFMPAWYKSTFANAGSVAKALDGKRSLANRKPLSTASRITPLLLRLSWIGKPLKFTDGFGWTFEVESESDSHYSIGDRFYRRVPHKDGDNANCGNPLAKDYIDSLEKNVLTSALAGDKAKQLIDAAIATSYWKSVRERVFSQIVHNGKIKPMVMVHGTVTRRAVENLWLTVSGAKRNKIGSELKSRVQAKSGKVFVHADFDAQELTIAGAFSDARAIRRNPTHGSTPMSYINLTGNKDDKTDGHSLLAKDLNDYLSFTLKLSAVISRGTAKTINFALLYMAGVATLASYIKKSAKELTESQAKAIAKEAINRRRGKSVKTAFGKAYVGGTDSQAYNYMSSIADSADPKTPLLRSRIASSLRPAAVKGDYLTSRMNWTIQSSGVDLLHSFLTAMSYLIELWNISGARFLFSFHDEILYEVDESDAKLLAKAFQVAHIWTWSYFYESVGIRDIADHRAWFSAVELDRVFRKEAAGEDMEHIITPSNSIDAEPGVVLKPADIFA